MVRGLLEDQGVDERIILKRIVKKGHGLDSSSE
jgi:hypothetical protein